MTAARGGCLCGGVSYAVSGPLRPIEFCHCTQCRKTSGHFVAATACDTRDLEITADESLEWYRSSAKAERGFCRVCGSSIFWRPVRSAEISIMAGTLDGAHGLAGVGHIFVADAGDYYEIDDGLPQHSGDWPAKEGA
jgi:hypothetical protein